MAQLIGDIRAPHDAMLATELARADSTALSTRQHRRHARRCHLRCAARQRDAEICFSPGFRWGGTLLAGRRHHLGRRLQRHRHHLPERATADDDRRADQGRSSRTSPTTCSIPIPTTSRAATWCASADCRSPCTSTSRWAPHPRPDARAHRRSRSRPRKAYTVAGWASVNEGTVGPPIWDIVGRHLQARRTVGGPRVENARLVRG